MSQVLYRDPVFDGATDPVMIFNRAERTWWMMYTSRRASAPGSDVGWVHGSQIGAASLMEDGVTWLYRGTLDLEHEFGHNTFWAPEIVWHNGLYHMYVSYIRGVPERWSGHRRNILHYTSEDLLRWTYEGKLALSSDYVIDACVCERPGGGYRLWYKDEADGSSTWVVDSEDLSQWERAKLAVRTQGGHEGPNVFWFRGFYWLVVDVWSGQAVFRSEDQVTWEEAGKILEASEGENPGDGVDVGPGHHADVVVDGDRAFIVYFTHPWRHITDASEWDRRRSVVLAAELEEKDGVLLCDRRRPLAMTLPCAG
jgi:GH43 family beta-xylosidase